MGTEGKYQVSDEGRVRRAATGRVLKQQVDEGYCRVQLRVDGRTRNVGVHVLVLTTFTGPRPPGYETCHGPGGRSDNRHTNLRWGTHTENMADRTWRVEACPRGHEYTDENTYTNAGKRYCRQCRRDRKRVPKG